MISTDLTIDLNTGHQTSAVLTAPDAGTPVKPAGIVLAHGTANDMNHPLIRSVAQGLSENGFTCLRFNFLYRELQKKSVDPEHRLIHTWQQAIAGLKKETGLTRIIAAGKSLWARIAAQAAAAGQIDPEKLLFLGYPLHAPGRKETLRDAPLLAIRQPLLFVEGTRDPFCDLTLLDKVMAKRTARTDLMIIANGNHSFDLPKSDPRTAADIYAQITAQCLNWLA